MILRALLILAFVGGGAASRPLHASGEPVARAATPEELASLETALEQTARDMGRWAYTETLVIRDEKGRRKSDVIVRYDPSKPYEDQWTPVLVNGKPPAASDRAKYRRQGERAGRREEQGESGRRYSLGELLDVRRSRVVEETAQHLVFEVPLRAERNNRFPPEKFEVLVYVGREPVSLERIALRLRESFRSNLVIKVKSGDGILEFSKVDPEHAPTLTAIRGDASASVLFVSVGGELELKRAEFKRVKPFAERFDVQIGTLKSIDF